MEEHHEFRIGEMVDETKEKKKQVMHSAKKLKHIKVRNSKVK